MQSHTKIDKTVCVTGHRKIPQEHMEQVREKLHREINRAILDGYCFFISGFADGIDIMFAEIVIEKMKNHAITLEAAIPSRIRVKKGDERFHELLSQCKVTVLSEQYHSGVYRERNQYMVDNSSRVIAVYNGDPKTGTGQTMRMAHKLHRDVRVILISPSSSDGG